MKICLKKKYYNGMRNGSLQKPHKKKFISILDNKNVNPFTFVFYDIRNRY